MNTRSEHIAFIDHMRGVAILSVFFFHGLLIAAEGQTSFDPQWNGLFRDFNLPLSYALLTPVSLGWIGVPIFFALSGFCIHLSHQRSRSKSFTIFFTRRFFRIYPPYLFALLFFCVCLPQDKAGIQQGSAG